MMIAARLAGGNLFFAFFVVEDFFGGGFFGALGAARSCSELLGAARSTRIFLRGILWWGIFGSTRSTRIFFEGICGGGILFFGGWWGVFWIVSVGKN